MTKEVVSACKGALKAGATEIVVRDGHGKADNIDIKQLPKQVKLIRGWSGHPDDMMEGINDSFDAIVYIGYHGAEGSAGNPLSHTATNEHNYVNVNGKPVSEFEINTIIASDYGVLPVFVSGDEAICEDAKTVVKNIKTVAVKKGVGHATYNISPELAYEQIEKGVYEALKAKDKMEFTPAKKFEIEVNYREHFNAYKHSFYPGAKLVDAKTIKFTANTPREMATFMLYVL